MQRSGDGNEAQEVRKIHQGRGWSKERKEGQKLKGYSMVSRLIGKMDNKKASWAHGKQGVEGILPKIQRVH